MSLSSSTLSAHDPYILSLSAVLLRRKGRHHYWILAKYPGQRLAHGQAVLVLCTRDATLPSPPFHGSVHDIAKIVNGWAWISLRPRGQPGSSLGPSSWLFLPVAAVDPNFTPSWRWKLLGTLHMAPRFPLTQFCKDYVRWLADNAYNYTQVAIPSSHDSASQTFELFLRVWHSLQAGAEP